MDKKIKIEYASLKDMREEEKERKKLIEEKMAVEESKDEEKY